MGEKSFQAIKYLTSYSLVCFQKQNKPVALLDLSVRLLWTLLTCNVDKFWRQVVHYSS